jgi:hypothetical protein
MATRDRRFWVLVAVLFGVTSLVAIALFSNIPVASASTEGIIYVCTFDNYIDMHHPMVMIEGHGLHRDTWGRLGMFRYEHNTPLADGTQFALYDSMGRVAALTQYEAEDYLCFTTWISLSGTTFSVNGCELSVNWTWYPWFQTLQIAYSDTEGRILNYPFSFVLPPHSAFASNFPILDGASSANVRLFHKDELLLDVDISISPICEHK